MAKGMKNWTEIKNKQNQREKKGCVVTVDHDKVNAIFEQYKPKLDNQKKHKTYGT